MNKKTIIVASGNKHKIEEIKNILSPLGYDITSMKEVGINLDIEEKGKTFEENAMLKARALREITKEMVLADDSGLEVRALNNAPGVYSARYAGEHGNDKKNNEKLLDELKDLPLEERKARFRCVIAVIFPDGREIMVSGDCEGVIGFQPKGDNGFGYDPLFLLPQLGKTFAQLSEGEKNRISHRARALEKLKMLL